MIFLPLTYYRFGAIICHVILLLYFKTLRVKCATTMFNRLERRSQHSYISTQTGLFPFCSIFTFPQNRQHTTNKYLQCHAVGKVTLDVLPFFSYTRGFNMFALLSIDLFYPRNEKNNLFYK